MTLAAKLILTPLLIAIGTLRSGLLSPFSVFATVMAVFSHRTAGPSAAIHLLRGVVIGSLAFASFFVIVALMLRSASMLLTYSSATVVALVVNGMTLARLMPICKRT